MFKLPASRKALQPPSWQLSQWHSSASPEELWPLDLEIYGEITEDSRAVSTCPSREQTVFTPQPCFEETHCHCQEGTLACCLVFLGLLLLFFNRELVALSPYSAEANLPWEAQGPRSDCTPQTQAPKQLSKQDGRQSLTDSFPQFSSSLLMLQYFHETCWV